MENKKEETHENKDENGKSDENGITNESISIDENKIMLELFQTLQEDYKGIEEVILEDEAVFCIYADDDTLWRIFEDKIDHFRSIEFNAGDQESHYLRVIL